jgi:hypothetical protein
VRPEPAARGCGEQKEGAVDRYVFRGFAYIIAIRIWYNQRDRDDRSRA